MPTPSARPPSSAGTALSTGYGPLAFPPDWLTATAWYTPSAVGRPRTRADIGDRRGTVGVGPRHRDHGACISDAVARAGHRDAVGSSAVVTAKVRRRRCPPLRRAGRRDVGGSARGDAARRPLRPVAAGRLGRAVSPRLQTPVAGV